MNAKTIKINRAPVLTLWAAGSKHGQHWATLNHSPCAVTAKSGTQSAQSRHRGHGGEQRSILLSVFSVNPPCPLCTCCFA